MQTSRKFYDKIIGGHDFKSVLSLNDFLKELVMNVQDFYNVNYIWGTNTKHFLDYKIAINYKKKIYLELILPSNGFVFMWW